MESCANCKRPIGKLEVAHQRGDGSKICTECASRASARPFQIPTQQLALILFVMGIAGISVSAVHPIYEFFDELNDSYRSSVPTLACRAIWNSIASFALIGLSRLVALAGHMVEGR